MFGYYMSQPERGLELMVTAVESIYDDGARADRLSEVAAS